MKRLYIAGGALAVVMIVLPMFAAFEAHVVNVTATIENALSVNTDPLMFGNVFPEEVLHKPLAIGLSSSFISEGNTGASVVNYFIRQKPKCGVPINGTTTPQQYSSFVQVTDVGTSTDEHFACPMVSVPGANGTTTVQSVPLPSLCPFLSKHSDIPVDTPNPDGNIDAFHGTLPWTFADSISTTVHGSLTKGTDVLDTWDIDLHAPCFAGSCAQDHVVPLAYQLDPALEHQMLGCDLWVEVDGINGNGSTSTPGTLTINKVIVTRGSNEVVDATPPATTTMSFAIDGGSNTAFEADASNAVSVSAANHSVLETVSDADYVATYSNSLNGNANCNALAVPAAGNVICTITNTFDGTPSNGNIVVRAVDLDPAGNAGPTSPAPVVGDGLNKWFLYNDTNDTVDNTLGSFVVGTGTPPLGTGSVRFTLGANPLDRKNIATYQFQGLSLASITQMGFAAYSNSGVAGANESPFLNFNVDFTGTSTAFQNRLVFVPANNGGATQDTWNTFDAINGGNANWVYSGANWPAPISLPGTTPRTWTQILAAYPSARILPIGGWLGVRVGEPGPTNYTANVDNFKIATSGPIMVFDFDN